MITYNHRCALCGQLQITEDRELLLEQERFEWDESLVDDFITGSRHLCVDTDPHGARESARMIEAGLMVPELRWLIEAELERRQAAGRPAWAVFTGASIVVLGRAGQSAAMVCRRPASGSVRAAEGRVHDCLPADWPSRSPPRCARPVASCTTTRWPPSHPWSPTTPPVDHARTRVPTRRSRT